MTIDSWFAFKISRSLSEISPAITSVGNHLNHRIHSALCNVVSLLVTLESGHADCWWQRGLIHQPLHWAMIRLFGPQKQTSIDRSDRVLWCVEQVGAFLALNQESGWLQIGNEGLIVDLDRRLCCHFSCVLLVLLHGCRWSVLLSFLCHFVERLGTFWVFDKRLSGTRCPNLSLERELSV